MSDPGVVINGAQESARSSTGKSIGLRSRGGSRDLARFWSRVDTGGSPDACHPWTGRTDADGYGIVSVAGASVRAHRFALALYLGAPLTKGTVVMHGCDNPACCNPGHLQAGTQQENIADRDAKGRTQKGERHWKCKLTADDVSEIRKLSAAGASRASLASLFGVARSTIYKIVVGENWRHLPAPDALPESVRGAA